MHVRSSRRGGSTTIRFDRIVRWTISRRQHLPNRRQLRCPHYDWHQYWGQVIPITLATIPCPQLLFGAISGKVLGIFVQEAHQKCYGTYHAAADPLSDIIEHILFYGCWMRESLPDPDLANSAGNYEWVL